MNYNITSKEPHESNETKAVADAIISILFTKGNEHLNREQAIQLIVPNINKLAKEQRQVGINQAKSHMKATLENIN